MTTGKILKTARQSRLDSLESVGKITGYSRQHIADCEKDRKCFSKYPEIVQYVLTVTKQTVDAEEVLRDWLKDADESDKRLRNKVKELAQNIVDLTTGS